MMRIALSNVIDNAVKYSEGGVIRIDCRREGRSVLVRICDQGQGIDPADAELIFQRYRRGTSKKTGSGLGLFVARQVAHACGGDLYLIHNTDPSTGCCFEFALAQIEAG